MAGEELLKIGKRVNIKHVEEDSFTERVYAGTIKRRFGEDYCFVRWHPDETDAINCVEVISPDVSIMPDGSLAVNYIATVGGSGGYGVCEDSFLPFDDYAIERPYKRFMKELYDVQIFPPRMIASPNRRTVALDGFASRAIRCLAEPDDVLLSAGSGSLSYPSIDAAKKARDSEFPGTLITARYNFIGVDFTATVE